MALYKCFTLTSTSKLPDPKGPLSKEVPSSTISTINTKVKKVIEVSNTATEKKIRAPYVKLGQDVKAQVGKYAAENGPIATLRKFAKTHPNLKEST